MGPTKREILLLRRITELSSRGVRPGARKKVAAKRTVRPMLPAEKRDMLKKRRETKAALEKAITAVHEEIWDRCEDMACTLGKHDAAWYYSRTLQQPQKKLNQRKPNQWNAFVRASTKRRNEGVWLRVC